VTAAKVTDRSFLLWALALAAGAAAIAAAGLAPQALFPSDTANYLDICYQSARGLRLDGDFLSPIGPAAILPTTLAMRLGLVSANALVAGSVLAWLGYGSVAWLVARPRMPGAIALGFALFAAGTAAAPYTLDFGRWHVLSYGMLYNRLAWAAVAIAASSLLAARDQTRLAAAWGAAGHGLCAAWLWAIKPNFLLILAPLSLCSLLGAGRRGAAGWLGRFVLGAIATLALVALVVPFDPWDCVQEHLHMGEAAPVGLLLGALRRALKENALPVTVLLGGWLIASAALRRAASRAAAIRRLGLVVALIGAGFIANMVNCQYAEIPLWGALGWILAADLTAGAPQGWSLLAVAIGLGLGLAYTWQPVTSIAYALAWKRLSHSHAAVAEVATPAWAGLPLCYAPGAPALSPAAAANGAVLSPGDFADWLNDGLQLAARVRPVHGAVLCLDWGNPFSFALGSPPVPGDLTAWSIGRQVDARHLPAADRLLAGAALVMEPRQSIQPQALAFKQALFAAGLKRDFVLAAETGYWRAWVRAPGVPASP